MSNQTATAVNAIKYSAEQAARAMLDRMGVPNAQNYSSGELVELAKLIAAASKPAPASAVQNLLHWALGELLGALPERRDWLNPDAEKVLRAVRDARPAPANATGETDREMALRFKREADALWHRVHPAEQNAARYIAWRDAMLISDQKFLDAMAVALPADVGQSREPTAEEWDAAIDKAAGLPVTEASEQKDRKAILLKAAYDLLQQQAKAGYALNLLYEEAHYDGTDCDGRCLLSDIADELGLDDDGSAA